MEENTKPANDCGCSDGCCTPKKKPNWVKYISILILLAALSVIAVKVVQDKNEPAKQCCPAGGSKSCCADSSKTAATDTVKDKGCCSKPGK